MALGCNALQAQLDRLAVLIQQAEAMGLGGTQDALGARQVFDDLDGYVAFIPGIGTDCDKAVAEAAKTVERMKMMIAAAGTKPDDRRPDLSSEGPGYSFMPSTGVLIVVGLLATAYMFGPLIHAGSSSLAKRKARS